MIAVAARHLEEAIALLPWLGALQIREMAGEEVGAFAVASRSVRTDDLGRMERGIRDADDPAP